MSTDTGDEASWGASDVVARYGTEGHTDAGERAALDAVRDAARGRVLDVGVGGGRTTGLLSAHATAYVGVDAAPEMVHLARSRFPDADLRVGDARDLAGLPDAGFDLVVFSFNGLDSLDRPGRAAALAALARMTAPEGRVVFSGLNLDGVSFDERPWRLPGGLRSARSRHHLVLAVRHPLSAVRAVRNHRRTRHLGEDGQGWGRRALRAHEFRFIVHFATLAELVRGAEAAGLEVVTVFADDGRELDPRAARTDADYVHLVCRVAGGDPDPTGRA